MTRSDIAGRVLEQVDVVALGDGARVSVRFGCPLRYSSHFPATGATELRISLVPLPGCLPSDVVDSALRAPGGNAAGLGDVRLEPAGTALMLTLTFSSPVDVAVRPLPDFMGLDIAVFNQAAVARPRVQNRATASMAPLGPPPRVLPGAEVLEKQWMEAKSAFDSGDNPAAVRLLTRLIEYPEHPRRAEAQELLGLARERNGQLAHAKAEYEEYLRRYPDGPAVGRVAQRLSALTTLRFAAECCGRRKAGRRHGMVEFRGLGAGVSLRFDLAAEYGYLNDLRQPVNGRYGWGLFIARPR